jgi:photosystem II stability/assembly factor-like uncharacterized protein
MKTKWVYFIGISLAALALSLTRSGLPAMVASLNPAVQVTLPPALTPPYTTDCEDAWHRYTPSAGVTAYATLNADAPNATNRAEWRPSLSEAGTYQVEVYIPNPPTVDSQTCFGFGGVTQNTSQAVYTIQHASGTSTVTIDQQATAGGWVSLGAFSFSAGTTGYISLRDLNSETKFTRFVVFSEVRFTPAEMAFFPVVRKQEYQETGSIVIIRNRQAFDTCYRPTLDQMQTWWNASPYYVYNLYLGGVSNAACHPETLTADWIAAARSQGWEFIPTWVGPQAPCTTFRNRFSMDPNNAFGQGIYEAELAFARAVELGLTGSIDPSTVIYYDMEAFYGGSAECRLAVQYFLSGWSQRLHELDARSGVYGSSCYYMPDWQYLTNPIDDVWLASWYRVDHDNDPNTDPVYYYDPNANVWNVACSSQIANSWLDQQRLRQYAGAHSENWGGVSINIDSSIVDGRIVSPFSAIAPDTTPIQADLAHTAPAVLAATPAIVAYQLVAPGMGWVLQAGRLLWTDDSGATWSDRTPENLYTRWLGVHFQNRQAGWALVMDSERDGINGWHVLKTDNGGSLWQATGLPVDPGLAELGEAAFFDFIDANQGWLAIRLRSGSSFSLGLLFATQDGGQTWQQVSIPLGEAVSFVDSLTGWTAGGVTGEELYVTRDGGQTWQAANFIKADAGAVFYSLPEFRSSQTGLLTVTVAEPGKPRVEVYRTQDGGQNWQIAGVVPLDPEMPPTRMVPAAYAGDQALLAVDEARGQLFIAGQSNLLFTPEGVAGLPEGVVELEFANAQVGWARVALSACSGSKAGAEAGLFACQQQDAIYQTVDGGVTWTKIR